MLIYVFTADLWGILDEKIKEENSCKCPDNKVCATLYNFTYLIRRSRPATQPVETAV